MGRTAQRLDYHSIQAFGIMKSSVKRSPNVPKRKELISSTLPFPVVGIGASADGLQAVKSFFEHMPHDNGMAFWPAMTVTVLAAWLIGSQRPRRRMIGFIFFSLSNVL
jgi:chemotaxis response regulator CheB